ncbi:PREDICTED: uncharacterized protein LOC104699308 [Camelina sativa]|uniref:Uncharacterized protein LOC104699308 n=1 Tax=Camelina sativa TaxID=90675 RepID=A0ABM0SLE1_CAMSA|nr:PREDICTED: uncharacterized protein LOC104699308 [Camelina sativa]
MDPDLSDLKIVNVAIDTSQDLSEGLNAKNATVYISYKDSCEARVGKDVDRIAIVRRTFCERTRQFTLRGRHQSLEIIPKKRADQGEDDSCEAGVGEDADRVRSSSSEHTRRLSPMCQQNLSSDKKCKYQRVIRPRLSVLKKWRFLSPRRHKACKNHGVGLARPLHKTRSI